MSVKINIIKPIEKKKLTYADLKPGDFFFIASSFRTKDRICFKTNIKNQFIEIFTGFTNLVLESDVEVLLLDVTIDVRIKE